ncbi:MAG: hypothetical protein AAGB31_14340 [Bdellovibrio sp.]
MIYTLEIDDKVRIGSSELFQRESVLEVDYDGSGFVHEIRVHSEYFGAFAPVSEAWIENNFPIKLKTIYDAVAVARSEVPERSYNNDDPFPAA